MKKNVFSVFAMFIAVVFSALCFSACQQDEEILSAASPTDDVVIKMSVPSSADGLRSATGNQDIQEGDTVDVENLKDVNIILSATDNIGTGIDGTWSVYNIDNDQSDNNIHANGYPGASEEGRLMSIKLSQLGLYRVTFKPRNSMYAQFSCYIRHSGAPGELGDTWTNSLAFRLDKLSGQLSTDNNYKIHKGYTAYIRYAEDFPKLNSQNQIDPSQPGNFHAFIYGGSEIYYGSKGQVITVGKQFALKKCKYSPEFYCFNFLEEDFPGDDRYRIYFYSGLFGEDWWVFPLVYDSDWKANQDACITFMPL